MRLAARSTQAPGGKAVPADRLTARPVATIEQTGPTQHAHRAWLRPFAAGKAGRHALAGEGIHRAMSESGQEEEADSSDEDRPAARMPLRYRLSPSLVATWRSGCAASPRIVRG